MHETRKSISLPAHLRLDAAVLRNAPFGDGHVGLDFKPADDRGLQPLGRAFHLVQHAVNPVADAEGLGQRLQMNVRRPRLERLHNQSVDQLDDRRVGFHHRPVVRHVASWPERPLPLRPR